MCREAKLGITKSLFVSLVVSLNPLLYTQSNIGYSEVVYTSLLFFLSYLFLKLWRNWVSIVFCSLLIGIVFSISYLIRAEVLACVVISLFFLVLMKRDQAILKRLSIVHIIVAIVFSTLSIYVWYLNNKLGYVAISGKTDDVFFNYGGRVDALIRGIISSIEIVPKDTVLEYIVSNPLVFIWRMFFNGWDIVITLFSTLTYIILPALGFMLFSLFQKNSQQTKSYFLSYSFSNNQKKVLSALLWVVVTPVVILLPFYIADRFMLPYSAGVCFILALFLVNNIKTQIQMIVCTIFIGTCSLFHPFSLYNNGYIPLLSSFYSTTYSLSQAHSIKHFSLPYRKAAEWLSNNISFDGNINIAGPKKRSCRPCFL